MKKAAVGGAERYDNLYIICLWRKGSNRA